MSEAKQARQPAPAVPVDRADLKSIPYELFMLALAILSIVNIVLEAWFGGDSDFESQSWWLVAYIDVILSFIFLGDFCYRLTTAPSRWGYFGPGRGFLDLLSCPPGLRILRLFRIVRAVRTIRRLGGRRVVGELRGSFATGTLYLVVFSGIFVLELVGLLELHFEEGAPGANIETAGDALWWGYVTATTVGYGDYYPVTTGGRLVGWLMLTVGVALFATFSGYLANKFLTQRSEEPETDGVGDAHAALHEIERLLAEQQRATEQLRARLAELEA